MVINTLWAIIALMETHTITDSTHILTLGRLAYMCIMINDAIL